MKHCQIAQIARSSRLQNGASDIDLFAPRRAASAPIFETKLIKHPSRHRI